MGGIISISIKPTEQEPPHLPQVKIKRVISYYSISDSMDTQYSIPMVDDFSFHNEPDLTGETHHPLTNETLQELQHQTQIEEIKKELLSDYEIWTVHPSQKKETGCHL